jgi:hypothetical protein
VLEPAASEPIVILDQRRVLGAQNTGALTLGISGFALLVVGSALGGVAALRWAEAQEACADFRYCPDARGPDLAAEARLEANLSTAAFVIGGLAVAGAATLWLSGPSPFRLQIVTGGSSVRASVSW